MLDFIRVIDWMMRLPKALELSLKQDRPAMEEAMGKPYVTSFERLAREEGLEQGQRRMLSRLIAKRFGELPKWAADRLDAATESQPEAWSNAMLSADSLSSIFSTEER